MKQSVVYIGIDVAKAHLDGLGREHFVVCLISERPRRISALDQAKYYAGAVDLRGQWRL